MLPVSNETRLLRQAQNLIQGDSSFELIFFAKVPALGFATYFVNSTKSTVKSKIFKDVPKRVYEDADEVSIENEFIKLSFTEDTGHLTSMTDKSSKTTTVLSQGFYWYNGSLGEDATLDGI